MAIYDCEECGTKCNECGNCDKLIPFDKEYSDGNGGIFCDEDCFTEYYAEKETK